MGVSLIIPESTTTSSSAGSVIKLEPSFEIVRMSRKRSTVVSPEPTTLNVAVTKGTTPLLANL